MKRLLYLRIAGFLLLAVLSSVLLFARSDVKGLLVSGSDVLKIVNGTFNYSQDIVVEGNATLLVENATIVFEQTSNNQYGIILRNPSNGNPKLIARNANFTSARNFEVSLMDNSSAVLTDVQFAGRASIKSLELYDSSIAEVLDDSLITYTYTYDSSSMKSVGSSTFFLYAYDNSSISVKAGLVNNINAYENSTIDVSISDVKYDVTASGSSSISFRHSYFAGRVTCSQTSRLLIENTLLEHVTFRLFDYGNVTVFNATSMPTRDPTNFLLRGFSTVSVSNCYFIKTLLDVYDNCSLGVDNSKLSGVIITSFGNGTIQILNSTVDWLVECTDSSELTSSDSSFQILSGKEFSRIELARCYVGRLRGYDSSNVSISDSTIAEVAVELASLNINLTGFTEGFFADFDFTVGNYSVAFTDVKIEGWTLNLLGSSNVTLEDSTLINLNTYGFSKALLLNSTYVNINVRGKSMVTMYSYLIVRVIDYFGAPVEGVAVTVSNGSGIVESKLTTGDGTVSFELLERVINSTRNSPQAYSVNVAFGDYSYSSELDLKGLKLLVSTIPSPWWYWYMISGIVVAVAVVLGFGMFWYWKKRRRA